MIARHYRPATPALTSLGMLAGLATGCASYQIPDESWAKVQQLSRSERTRTAVPAERGGKLVYLRASDLREVDAPSETRPGLHLSDAASRRVMAASASGRSGHCRKRALCEP